MHQNYPNPFNPVTKIVFEIPAKELIRLEIFDVTGWLITELISSQINPGKYSYELNASNLNSGVYFYRLSGSSFSETKKLVVMK